MTPRSRTNPFLWSSIIPSPPKKPRHPPPSRRSTPYPSTPTALGKHPTHPHQAPPSPYFFPDPPYPSTPPTSKTTTAGFGTCSAWFKMEFTVEKSTKKAPQFAGQPKEHQF